MYRENNVNEKMEYISTINDENCKFLSNIYGNYIKDNKNIDIKEYALLNNCTCNLDLDSVIQKCLNSNLLLIIFLLEENPLYKKITEKLDIEKLKYVVSNSSMLKKLDINNSIKESSCSGAFLYFQLDDFNMWYNWNVELEERIKKVIEKVDKISLDNLTKNAEEQVKNLLMTEKLKKQKDGINKFSLLNVIKKLDKNKWNKSITHINLSYSKNVNYYYIKDFIDIIQVIKKDTDVEKYEYIYDILCDDLEKIISKYNYCLFEGSKCIAKRDNAKWPNNSNNGCCFNVKTKIGCEYLEKKSCKIKCISCRLFTCKYLKDRGIDFNVRENILVKYSMNILQKPELIWNFFTPKEEIIKKINRFNIKLR